MYDMYKVLLTLILTMVMSMVFTEIVRKLSFKLGTVDKPNSRRVNKVPMPSSGGLAIYVAFYITVLFLIPINREITIPLFVGATIIIIIGLIDDVKEINPKMKMLGILLATLAVYYLGDIQMTRIDIPFLGLVELGILSLPVTFIWIAAITNSINLIDGLDGLAAGVSSISLLTIGIIAFFFLGNNNVDVAILIFALVAAQLGFLPANYFPARIYLGDTGALFLGFMTAVFSLMHLKNVTFLSLTVPLVILAVPIGDTLYAIIRRTLNKEPISMADNKHIHHRVLALGFSHKQSVKLLYTMTAVFSVVALLLPVANTLGFILLTISLIVSLQFLAELIGLVDGKSRFLTDFLKKIFKLLRIDHRPK